MELVEFGKQAIAEMDDTNPDSLRKGVTRIRRLIDAIGTESIPGVLDGIVKSIPELAEKLGKAAPHVVIKSNHVRLTSDVAPVLKNVLVHEFRNSLDHGLESPGERQAAGKPAEGTITLEAVEEQDGLVLRLYDDGRGLALEKIRRKAVEQGLLDANAKISDAELAQLIFMSGMSTADTVSDISGRGVGMDAVKRFVTSLGGHVELKLTGQAQGSARYCAFEARINLPKHLYTKVA
jgi:two-component system chemotaxis sensor kinase CheA